MNATTAVSKAPIVADDADGPGAPDWPIMVVDDSRVSQRLAARLIEQGTGRPVVFADSGHQALALLDETCPALVLTDIQMPGMDGFELVQAIRASHPRIPVIIMTAFGSEAAAMRALQAGAANYVPKKKLLTDLVETIRQVLTIVAVDHKKQKALSHQTSRTRTFEIDSDTGVLPPLIDLIREDFDAFAIGDETAGIRLSVAIQESLANAVYHGNLECSSDLRQDDEKIFYDLAKQRRMIEPYRSRRIQLQSHVTREEARIVIRDDGPGFDTATLDKPFDPEDLMRVGGRGMVLIRTFLDEVSHNPKGNEITLVKRKNS